MNSYYAIIQRSLLAAILLVTTLSSCKKLDYTDEFTTFANVYFINNSVIQVDMQARYNGEPIAWNHGSGEIRCIPGKAELAFYDRRTNTVQAEKTITIDPARPDTFLLFQPVEGGQVSFLDPKAQANEAAAPEGFMKIKIANYTPELLPYEKIDVIVIAEYYDEEFNTIAENIDTIFNVSQNLDDETYHTVLKANHEINGYRFSFRDHATGQEVKSLGGTAHLGLGFYPYIGVKHIFTIYLTAYEEWGEHESFIKKGEKFYSVVSNVLFED